MSNTKEAAPKAEKARGEEVLQAEVERLLILRQQALEARTAAAKRQAELAAEEERLKAALKAGATMEPGPYLLLLATEPTARSVAWRQVVEEHLGRGFAEQVLAGTPPGAREVLKILQEVKVDGRPPVAGGTPERGPDGDGRGR